MSSDGIYIHFPFCARLCPYCDFAVNVRKEIPQKAYTDAVLEEIASRAHDWKQHAFSTIYLGGVTPSLWEPAELRRVIEHLRSRFQIQLEEFTIEANPQDITGEKIEAWKQIGIDRVSLGIQSFSDPYLRRLGRTHTGEDAQRAIELLRKADVRVTGDLIFAGPEQTATDFENDLRRMASLVDHMSVYSLTIEKNTQFYHRLKKKQIALPSEEDEDHFYDVRDAVLKEMGFDRYEVSNFARSGEEIAVHNCLYWKGASYLGIGVGAHSLRVFPEGFERSQRDRKLKTYLRGESPLETLPLLPEEHGFERMFLAVRTRFAFSPRDILERELGLESQIINRYLEVLNNLKEGWIEENEGIFRMTWEGLDFSDTIALRF